MHGPTTVSETAAGTSLWPYRLDIAGQSLWREGVRVPLGSRAFAILCALIERPGRLVSKLELFERVWPGISVDEANLRVQVGALLRALGEHGRDIFSVTGLGSRFIGQLEGVRLEEPSSPPLRLRAP